jgi:hypothetical protein
MILTLACSYLFATPVNGQHQHDASKSSAAPLAALGITSMSFRQPIPEAQRYFDQGLSLIYAFNHEESAKAFRRSAELDPGLAMAYWGVALAVGPNYNEPQIDPERMKAAVEALKKAKSASGSRERDRARVRRRIDEAFFA